MRCDLIDKLLPCIKCGSSERYIDGCCIQCKKKRNLAYMDKHSEKLKVKNSIWRENNRESARLTSAEWRRDNPEKAKETKRSWRLKNKTKENLRHAKWRKDNPEKVKAAIRRWVINNPDKVRAMQANYRKSNPGINRINRQNRRARTQASGGKLSRGLASKLFKLQKGKCACCKQPLGKDYHLDHIMPLALGGSNTDNNIQLLRQRCNGQKGAKQPTEFMQERGFLL